LHQHVTAQLAQPGASHPAPAAEPPATPSGAGKERSHRTEAIGSADEADEKELSIVAKRFLIAEANRLVEENQHLKQFKDKYHDVDKRLAALKETLKPLRTNEFLSSVCLATGSAGLGAAPTFLALSSYGWYVFVGLSAVLVLAGIAAKASGPTTGTTPRH
jgi:hypothetical protein